ncbi:hypothetical protein BYZ73_21230 [Rhodovulum viride]|uniref:Uncharacterized protein n=1 Tax=Rhodovulum viride TaxID=1231134 RepID=A0ABX9DC79_9RHOB|nr:hypothetical protein [Rhodovulum viride]RAP39304.1 hypothetical protein BYZ73_21230 [Rhodovulum viride]
MTTLSNDVLDAGLQEIRDAATPVLHLCSQEPTTYAEASSTYKLGTKTAPTISAQANRTGGGRKIDIATFTDGTVDANGTGTHWAVVDAATLRLLATLPVVNAQVMTAGNPLSLNTPIELGFSPAA